MFEKDPIASFAIIGSLTGHRWTWPIADRTEVCAHYAYTVDIVNTQWSRPRLRTTEIELLAHVCSMVVVHRLLLIQLCQSILSVCSITLRHHPHFIVSWFPLQCFENHFPTQTSMRLFQKTTCGVPLRLHQVQHQNHGSQHCETSKESGSTLAASGPKPEHFCAAATHWPTTQTPLPGAIGGTATSPRWTAWKPRETKRIGTSTRPSSVTMSWPKPAPTHEEKKRDSDGTTSHWNHGWCHRRESRVMLYIRCIIIAI